MLDFSTEFDGGDGGSSSGISSIVSQLIDSASSVATSAIRAGSASEPPPLYGPYGSRYVPGAGLYPGQSSGIGTFLLIGAVVVGSIFVAKKMAK